MEYPNTGALFRVKEKKHDKMPDMNGSLKIDKHYLLSLIEESTSQLIEIKFGGWTKESAAGNKYLSLKIDTRPPMEKAPKVENDDSDDIPF